MELFYDRLFQLMRRKGLDEETLEKRARLSKGILDKLKYPSKRRNFRSGQLLKICRATGMGPAAFVDLHDEESMELRKLYGSSRFRQVSTEDFLDMIRNRQGKADFLVNAPPGRGKTETVTKIFQLLIEERRISPSRILIICFSHAAVNAVWNRIKKRLGLSMTDLHICTLDSFCGQWNGKYQRFKDKMAKKLMEAERKKKDKAEDDAEEMTAEDSMVSSDVLDSIADDETDRLLAFHAPTYEYNIRHFIEHLDSVFQEEGNETKSSALRMAEDIWKAALLYFRYVIVDEVQDIKGWRARMLLSMQETMKDSSFIYLGDQCQAIYDFNADEPDEEEEKKLPESAAVLFKKLMALPSMSCYELDEPNHRAEKSLAWMEPYLADLRNPLRYHESHWAMQNLSDIQSRAKKRMLKEPFYKMAYRMVYGDSNRAILTRYNSDSFLLLWWFHKHLSYRSLMPFLRLRAQGGMGEDTPRLAGWIGLFFYKYKEKTIDRDAFKNHFQSVFTDERKGRLRLNAGWQSCWEALEQCQEKKKESYGVNEFFLAVCEKGWSSPGLRDSLIPGSFCHRPVICSIHQAKGLDFDEVYVNSEVFSPRKHAGKGSMLEDPVKSRLSEECRVSYVALTRARKAIYFYSTRSVAEERKKKKKAEAKVIEINAETLKKMRLKKKKEKNHGEKVERIIHNEELDTASYFLGEEKKKFGCKRRYSGARNFYYYRYKPYDDRTAMAGFPFGFEGDRNRNADDRKELQAYIYEKLPLGEEMELDFQRNSRRTDMTGTLWSRCAEKGTEKNLQTGTVSDSMIEEIRKQWKEEKVYNGIPAAMVLFNRLLVTDIVTCFRIEMDGSHKRVHLWNSLDICGLARKYYP